MKKISKSIILVALLSMVVLLLTGCGGDKLVATKTTEEEGYGKYEEKIEVTFKNNIVDNVKMTMDFEDKDTAASTYGLFTLASSMTEEDLGFEAKQDGNKVIINMNADTFKDQEGYDESEMTKEALKASLEEDGYTVK